MARQTVLLVLLLVFVGMVAAAADTAGDVHDIIGNTDDDDAAAPSARDATAPRASSGGARAVVEAPIGSVEEAKAHAGEYAQAPSQGGANALGISAATGAAVVVSYFVL